MKLRALFLGGILALGLMSFSTNREQSSLQDSLDATCNGASNPCCASPGRYLG